MGLAIGPLINARSSTDLAVPLVPMWNTHTVGISSIDRPRIRTWGGSIAATPAITVITMASSLNFKPSRRTRNIGSQSAGT